MEVTERRWFIENNRISTSLMRFHLDISFNEYYSVMTIIDNNMDYLNLNFANLENTFNFIENEVVYSCSLAEVNDRYQGYNKRIRKNKTKTKRR